jgi:hypothetical protein
MSTQKDSASLANVRSGDVLVSHPTATREHEISIVPNAPHAMAPTHDAAVNDGRSQADARGVDAWLTEDQTHVVKIASHRETDDGDVSIGPPARHDIQLSSAASRSRQNQGKRTDRG